MYVIFSFTEDDTVEAVPYSWCKTETTCFYPPENLDIKKLIAESSAPKKDWILHEGKILRKSKTYQECRQLLNKAEQTSDLGSETEALGRGKRHYKKRDYSKNICDSGTSMSEAESSNDDGVRALKRTTNSQKTSKRTKLALPKAPPTPASNSGIAVFFENEPNEFLRNNSNRELESSNKSTDQTDEAITKSCTYELSDERSLPTSNNNLKKNPANISNTANPSCQSYSFEGKPRKDFVKTLPENKITKSAHSKKNYTNVGNQPSTSFLNPDIINFSDKEDQSVRCSSNTTLRSQLSKTFPNKKSAVSTSTVENPYEENSSVEIPYDENSSDIDYLNGRYSATGSSSQSFHSENYFNSSSRGNDMRCTSVSLPVVHQRPSTSTRADEKGNTQFQKSILYMLGDLKANIGELNSKMNFVLDKLGYSQNKEIEIEGFPEIPLDNLNDLQKLENILDTHELKKQVVKKFSSYGGKTAADCCRRILRKVLAHSVILKFNWQGVNGKYAFKSLKLNDVVVAVQNNISKSKDFEIIKIIQNWVKYAPDREGGRERRSKTSNISD